MNIPPGEPVIHSLVCSLSVLGSDCQKLSHELNAYGLDERTGFMAEGVSARLHRLADEIDARTKPTRMPRRIK